MTDAAAMWRGDLERVLRWTSLDQSLMERLGARLDDDRRTLLNAAIETRGDVLGLAERLGPVVLERLRARSRQAAPERVNKAMDKLDKPLATAWAISQGESAEQVALQFLERYGTRLEELTGSVTKAVAAARAAGATMRGVASSKSLLDVATELDSQVQEMKAAAAACAHPEGAGSWGDRTTALAREGFDTAEAARNLQRTAQDFRRRCEAITTAFQEWSEAPAGERAAKAGSMATRLRAAHAVVAEMREQVGGISR